MSEYQYYEFVAIDGPISDEGLRYAERCSSRAEVSRVRWQNTYDFGDFHGSVETLPLNRGLWKLNSRKPKRRLR